MKVAATMPSPRVAIHPRTVLVGVDTVASVHGIAVPQVHELAEERLVWVWNVAVRADGARKELRFWSREIIFPESTARLAIEQVIASIVPRRDLVPGQSAGFSHREVMQLLRINQATAIELRAELQAVNVNGRPWVPRAGLETFLRRRWLGAA
jgi:hypothetical protein